jgi:hypothetical protein
MGSRRSIGPDGSDHVTSWSVAALLVIAVLLVGAGQAAGGSADGSTAAVGDWGSHTTGYNFVEYFDTTGCRKSPRDYSRQYQNDGPALGVTQSENDRFEDNDERATATHIQQGTLENLQIVDGESDYFAVNLTTGESITATARFEHSQGDLDMELQAPDGRSLDSSISVSDDETVSAVAAQNGTYYVEVYGYSGASAPYSLDVEVTDTDDIGTSGSNATDLEPNDDFDTAASVTAGRYTGLEINSTTDEDYYAVEVDAGQSLTASIEFSDAVGDLDMTVSGPDRDRLEGSYSVSDSERVEITAVESGTYYIEVNGYSGDTAPYTLAVSVDGTGPVDSDSDGPGDDDLDGTDPADTDGIDLRRIEIGATATGEIDDGDPESEENRGHYEPVTFNGSAGDRLTISMTSDEGDTYLILRGPDGEVVQRNDDGGEGLDSELSSVELPEDGVYTIVATSYSDFDTFEYTLTVSRGFAGGIQPTTMELTSSAPSVQAGDSVTVSFNLTNTADDTAPLLVDTDLTSLPPGWRITGHSDDGGTWRGGDAAWIFPAVASNASVRPSVTIAIPANASTEQLRAVGYAQRGQDAAPFTIEVTESG